MAKKIYLSPSNQSGNNYAYGNTNECDQCNRIADATKTALERCGFLVKKAPKGQDMNKSIAESNAWGSDLHMPIHTNAGGGSGTMCMVYKKATENMKYANPIYKAVQAVTPGKTDYGIREYPNLAELNNTNMIAVYTEVDFHDNATIAKWIINNTTTIGEAFAKGVCEAFGVKYKAPASSTTKSTASTTTTTTQKSSVSATLGAMPDRDKFISTARTYIGKNGDYVCKTKLGLKKVVDWCAYSVSAIMKDCGFIGKYQGGIYGYASDNAREDNGKYGEWFLKGTKAPQPGDLIMFKYASFTNPLDKYSASHVGIVEAVNGDVITTLEGNVDGSSSNWAATSTFKRKTRSLSSADVYSFYRFKWAITTSSSSSAKTTTTTSTTQKTTTTTKNSTSVYKVQVGAFSDKNNAQKQLDNAKKAGFKDAFITENKK